MLTVQIVVVEFLLIIHLFLLFMSPNVSFDSSVAAEGFVEVMEEAKTVS